MIPAPPGPSLTRETQSIYLKQHGDFQTLLIGPDAEGTWNMWKDRPWIYKTHTYPLPPTRQPPTAKKGGLQPADWTVGLPGSLQERREIKKLVYLDAAE